MITKTEVQSITTSAAEMISMFLQKRGLIESNVIIIVSPIFNPELLTCATTTTEPETKRILSNYIGEDNE